MQKLNRAQRCLYLHRLTALARPQGVNNVEGDGYPFSDREDLFADDPSPCHPGCDDDDLEGNKSDSGPWDSQDQDTLAQDAALQGKTKSSEGVSLVTQSRRFLIQW